MLKSQFILDLLHNDYGLCCVVLCIGASRYVVLDNDEMNIPAVLSQVVNGLEREKGRKNQRTID